MGERLLELQAILAEVRRRWTQRALLRSWMIAAAAAATILLAGLGAVLIVAREGLPLVVTVALVVFTTLFALARAFWPLRRRPTDRQLARYVEEKSGGLDDVLVTAVDYSSRPEASASMREWMAADAVRATRQVPVDTIVSRASIRSGLSKAVAATAVLVIVASFFAMPFERAANLAQAYLFPARVGIEVLPGNAKVRDGQPVSINARVNGLEGGFVPVLTIKAGSEAIDVRMDQLPLENGLFAKTIPDVKGSFSYHVSVAGTRSEEYTISVVRPARVERIDISYQFPQGLGLEPRVDEDSGDIYGPAGTKVKLTITTDKPIARAALALEGGEKIDLAAREKVLEGELTIEDDGSYRVALSDIDGLENAGDTEYFIRTLDDRPPDVRILRPAGDKQVTALEEVQIEARADDDYGIASFDLVFQAPGGKEKVVPFRGSNGGLTANGLHTMFMEDLGVQPGDFVTYFARARDVSRGRRSTEARSDIFFLEVKPFEEEFVAAQSQAMMGGAGGGDRGLQGLAEAQKEIIIATWKLDARGRRARDAKSSADVKSVSKAQSDLKQRAETASAQFSRATGRRRTPGGGAPGNDPIGKAIEAMGRAVVELDKVSTSSALPHEMEALNQLLKADAENRRRQIARQQQAGGGGGMNRSEADLSSLFDQELRKRNETNYETGTRTEERQENKQEDPLEKIRELARRQDALNRQQRDLAGNRAQIEQEELKRQLERLRREQNQLRQEAEQLARQMGSQQQRQQSSSQQQQQQQQQSSSQQSSNQQSGGQGQEQQGQQNQQGQQGSRQLREISEEMRNAATDMSRENSQQAMARGEKAAERLRELEKQLQASSPDDRRRALGDLQLETRQLADAQRRLANEASKTGQGQSGQDARRRLAGDQDRLAERTQRLQDNVKRLAKSGQGTVEEKRAIEDAARELDRQQVTERMRQSAEALRQQQGQSSQGSQSQTSQAQPSQAQQASRQGEAAARALDQIAERLGAASGSKDADSRRLSDQLAKTQELREKIAGIERDIDKLQRENAQQPQRGDRQDGQNDGQQGQQGQPGPQGQQARGQQGGQQSGQQSGQANQQGGEAGGNGGVQQLQREVNERMRDANRLADELRRENPGMQGAKTPEEWWRSFSAPGTEAFKQDFARWESLKKNLLVALENVESQVSDQLRARESKERLNAGGHTAVSESYRELVERYYRSLASPRKP